MKAAIYRRYGGPEVVQIEEVPTPAPTSNQILVHIHASALTVGDVRLRAADPFAARLIFGLFRPKLHILGDGFAGTVAQVGSAVTRFKTGDIVFGTTQMRFGAHAEYICVDANEVVDHQPADISHEQAAAVHFGGSTAWFFLQKARIQPGQKILIYGASGSVGSAAVQIARHLGAQVTAVCSGANADWVRRLGAHEVIDYTREDFSLRPADFDVVFETVNKAHYPALLRVLKPGGIVILGSAMLGGFLRGALTNLRGRYKMLGGVAVERREDLAFLKALLEQGALQPAIDRVFPLQHISEAHAYVQQGRKKGNVVILMP
jgi:NADPH:quinone reductase-like Zn-dependent oxidoreductase